MNIELKKPVPEWARWLAQDSDGKWMVYENKPTIQEEEVGIRYPFWTNHVSGGFYEFIVRTDLVDDWRQSLVDLRS